MTITYTYTYIYRHTYTYYIYLYIYIYIFRSLKQGDPIRTKQAITRPMLKLRIGTTTINTTITVVLI